MKTLVIMFKLKPSTLTDAIILFLKSYSFKRSIKFFAKKCHVILKASNKSIVTIIFLKNYNKGKNIMSTLWHLEIKISNHLKITFFKERQNICLFGFFHYVKQNIMWKKVWWRELNLNTKIQDETFYHTLSQNCKGKLFFTSKSARFTNFFVLNIILFERVFEGKKIRNEWSCLFILLVTCYFFKLPFITKFTSFQNLSKFLNDM